FLPEDSSRNVLLAIQNFRCDRQLYRYLIGGIEWREMRTRISVRDTLLRRMHVDLPSRLHSRWDDIELSISLVIGNAKRAAVNAVAASLCRGDLDTATLHRYAKKKGRGLIRVPVSRNCCLSYRLRYAVKHAQTRHIIPAHACKLRRRERIIVEGS